MTSFPLEMDRASDVMWALANPSRFHVLFLLTQGEMDVGSIAKAVKLSQSALSQHLRKLRDLGIVATRRDAQFIYYSLAATEVSRMIALLTSLFPSRS